MSSEGTVVSQLSIAVTKIPGLIYLKRRRVSFGLQHKDYTPSWSGKHGSRNVKYLGTLVSKQSRQEVELGY